jgi:hypothetical protein
MKDLGEEIRTAETRYYTGQLLSIFFLGLLLGGTVGWMIWT